MNDHAYQIYVLSEPGTGEPRYIGLTRRTLKARLDAHLYSKEKNRKGNWIKSIKNQGQKPDSRVLISGLTKEQAVELERLYIWVFRHLGCDLVNGTDGGEGVFGLSAEGREKIRAAMTGRKVSDETRAKLAKAHLGHTHSDEVRKKIGKARSSETRAKMSAAAKAAWERRNS